MKTFGREGILRNVNLNLLPILQLLLKTQSVSASANALNISQPAVSDALARLRVMLEDQLLVRVGSHMTLTGYAERLIEPLDRLCADMEEFLSKETFDPQTAKREFVIATSDLLAYLIARPILNMLVNDAPHISLHLVDIGSDLTAKMAGREIDLALLPDFALEDLAPAPLRYHPVVAMPRVVLMRAGHPLSKQNSVSDQDILNYKHVTFQPDPVLKSSKRLLMPTNGVQVEFVARLGHFLLVPYLLPNTDYIAIVPKQFADDMAGPLKLDSRPMCNPAPIAKVGLAWSPVQDHDPAHSWFRDAIITHFAEMGTA